VGTYFNRLLQVCVFLGGWMGAYFAVTGQRSYHRELVMRLELDSALREAELRALKSQINPHFLFNCLNSLRALVPLELARPREAITLLSDLLRAALAAGEQTTVSLAKELETVNTYLALEQIRHEERLRVVREISVEALVLPVPPFLIQGLVENALKYGIATREDGGEVGIFVELREGVLRVRVTNPGEIGVGHESTGLGLSNGRARLLHLFGAEARLTLTQAGPERVVAEVSIPVRTEAPS
jgi:LytS/YehU family sensor histidine kinase